MPRIVNLSTRGGMWPRSWDPIVKRYTEKWPHLRKEIATVFRSEFGQETYIAGERMFHDYRNIDRVVLELAFYLQTAKPGLFERAI